METRRRRKEKEKEEKEKGEGKKKKIKKKSRKETPRVTKNQNVGYTIKYNLEEEEENKQVTHHAYLLVHSRNRNSSQISSCLIRSSRV